MRRRTPRTRRAVGAVALAVVLGHLAACGSGDRLDAGEAADGPTSVTGAEYSFRVPSGGVTVTVGAPVPEAETGSGEALRAPEDGVLVPVSWELDRRNTAPVTGFAAETRIRLETGGTTADVATIPDTPTAGDSAYVAVPGAGSDIAVALSYDGVEQTVGPDGTRDSGAAEALYAETAAGVRQDCGEVATAVAGADVDCQVRSWQLPYLPDRGWAADGHVYVLVEPDLALWSVTAEGVRYRTTFVADASTVDGRTPDLPLERGVRGAGSLGGLMTVEVPAAEVHVWQVRAEFDLRGSGPEDGRTVSLHADVPLGG